MVGGLATIDRTEAIAGRSHAVEGADSMKMGQDLTEVYLTFILCMYSFCFGVYNKLSNYLFISTSYDRGLLISN